MAAKKKAAPKQEPTPKGYVRIVGEVVERPLSDVKPNPWNPNRMTPFMKKSLASGLQTDGWLKSQSLLIWGTDEKGKTRNLIIDGEHRWTVAGELGFKKGPMVFLHKLTESQAKGLTIKMNQKRGEHDEDALAAVLRSIQHDTSAENFALDLGIEEDSLLKLLAMEPVIVGDTDEPNATDGATPGEVPSGMGEHVKMVQLFFNKEQHEEFGGLVKTLAARFKVKNTTDTVLEAMRASSAPRKGR